MKTWFPKLFWSATVLGLICGSGCGKSGGNADTIKVGEYASLTGKDATFGISSHEGTLMAIEEINAGGGILGKKLELITEDTQCKPGEPATVVNKLITRDNVVAVLGEVASSRSLEAAPICQQNKIPMISPSSTNPDVTKTGDYIFRVSFIDPFQGTVMANFATKTLKAKRVAVFTDVKSDYSKGLAKFFKERFKANGGEIVIELDYNGGDKDFKAQLTAIKATNPDGVFVPGYYTECALISVQAKELGLKVPLFGGDGWESSVLFEIGGKAVEGNYLSTHYHPAVGTEISKRFVENYKKRWNGKTPDALAACGYDSAIVLADAIKRAGTTESAKLRDAIAATKDFPAVTGKITLNENRDAVKSAVILAIKDGHYEYRETVEP
ncbi:MAG TPA: ABC transporter substrate-binding protein [Candidatus Paceibacterota bacterium]|nr:ABC transporter substrate-binding protein [Candidatus Paceibacterota bacterium]